MKTKIKNVLALFDAAIAADKAEPDSDRAIDCDGSMTAKV